MSNINFMYEKNVSNSVDLTISALIRIQWHCSIDFHTCSCEVRLCREIVCKWRYNVETRELDMSAFMALTHTSQPCLRSFAAFSINSTFLFSWLFFYAMNGKRKRRTGSHNSIKLLITEAAAITMPELTVDVYTCTGSLPAPEKPYASIARHLQRFN